MTGDEKKKRDPIFMVCFVVFILAAVAVVGVYVDEHYLTKDTTKVAYGDNVTVDYVGTFYDFDGNEHAVEFDSGSIDFDAETGSDVLDKFWQACVGHQVGDRIEVIINPEDGYVAPVTGEKNISMNGLSMGVVQTMTKSQFDAVYDIDLTNGSMNYIQTVYGWYAMASLDSTTQMVTLTHMPEAGQTYTYTYDDGDDETEESPVTVTFRVTSTNNDTITYDIDFDGFTSTGNGSEVEMFELQFGDEVWQVTDVNETNNTFSYKTSPNTTNQTLYFVIEITEIS